ncbi:MAG: hypothetical protein CM15mP32_1980 [Flavobacteriaceae bacterium]|nr:MAG: hypothetical protein CM15mP32_1980 [Flavobacteriaceae bacterium]
MAARNTLRIEMGYCLYGNDIDDSTSPIAAGLRWCTAFSKDFVSKDIIDNRKQQAQILKELDLSQRTWNSKRRLLFDRCCMERI